MSEQTHIPTPETDAYAKRIAEFKNGWDAAAHAINFAESLERRLATVTAERDSLRRERDGLLKDKERLDAIESGCWTVRMGGSPIADTGDYSNWWEVIEHYMAKPHDRVIGHAEEGKLRSAIDAACQPEQTQKGEQL